MLCLNPVYSQVCTKGDVEHHLVCFHETVRFHVGQEVSCCLQLGDLQSHQHVSTDGCVLPEEQQEPGGTWGPPEGAGAGWEFSPPAHSLCGAHFLLGSCFHTTDVGKRW